MTDDRMAEAQRLWRIAMRIRRSAARIRRAQMAGHWQCMPTAICYNRLAMDFMADATNLAGGMSWLEMGERWGDT